MKAIKMFEKSGQFSLLILLSILMCFSVPTWANTAHQSHAFDEKLQAYIDVVNQTKTVLDDPNATPTALEQKQALCMRIQAYKNIVQLSQDHLELNSARVMHQVAQTFLERQDQSFKASAMSEQIFCASMTLKMAESNRFSILKLMV